MISPERGIRRTRIAAASLALGALAAVGITSGLAYADTEKTTVTDTSTTTEGVATTSDGTATDGGTTDTNGTTTYDAPGVTTGSGDSHARTSGS